MVMLCRGELYPCETDVRLADELQTGRLSLAIKCWCVISASLFDGMFSAFIGWRMTHMPCILVLGRELVSLPTQTREREREVYYENPLCLCGYTPPSS